MAKRTAKKAAKTRGGDERVETPGPAPVEAAPPSLEARVAQLEITVNAMQTQISTLGNSVNIQPGTVEVPADPYFSKGPKSTDPRTSG
jgi:hypothetical protein